MKSVEVASPRGLAHYPSRRRKTSSYKGRHSAFPWGVHYEIIAYDELGNEWMIHSTRKAIVAGKSVWT